MLRTKLYVPRPGERWVPRPRLLDRLETPRDRRLTLVSAPPGFGKTSVVSAWVATTEASVAWVSLEADDDDPVRFWGYVLHALGEDALVLEPALQAPTPAFKPFMSALINCLAERTAPWVLVLDDYHVLTQPTIHETLAHLIEHLPATGHLVIATRQDPPFALARWRARGWMSELRAAELRFDPAEVAAYMNAQMGLALGAPELEALAASTEGWITGLQLAALSLQRIPDRQAFVTAFTGTHRYILDYLIEEVLRVQPPAIQAFLLDTSVLERLSGPLCDWLRSGEGSQAILESLEQANLFLVPLDDERTWYRYHHLFADVLRHQLEKQRPGAARALHQRASAWYEAAGASAEAIHHALRAGDHERAADLIASAEHVAWNGEVQTLLGWIRALPAPVRHRRPELLLLEAWAVIPSGDMERLAALARHVAEALPAPADDEAAPVALARARLHVLEAHLARLLHSDGELLARSERALGGLPEDEWMWRAFAGTNLGVVYLEAGRIADMRAVLDGIIHGGRRRNHPFFVLTAKAIKGLALLTLGQLREAEAVFQAMRRFAETCGGLTWGITSYAWVGLGQIAYWRNELDQAEGALQEGLACADGIIDAQINGTRFLARIQRQRGDDARADALLDALGTLARQLRLEGLERVLETERALRFGPAEPAVLARWVAWFEPQLAVPQFRIGWLDEKLLLARALAGLGRLADALALYAAIEAEARQLSRPIEVIRALCQQAVLHAASGDRPRADQLFTEALALAQPEGHVRLLLDEGPALIALLAARQAWPPNIEAYAARLKAAAGLAPVAPEGLSARERDVLQLMASGLTNQQIASHLSIELNTVKRHGTNLFNKLAVSNRTGAIARARALGWLD